jgi:hypothetical protein
MSVEVGDAVLRFLADSTNLDAKFDEVGPNAEKAFDPATEAVERFGDTAEEAGERTQVAMREARGEVALLGEEFGIHLPRHVRSFIAEIPGVGEALGAAFSATAILFVAQAIVQVSEKLSKLTADFLIYTDTMKAADSEEARHDQTLQHLKDTLEKDQEALDKFGKSTLELAQMKVAKLTKALEAAKAAANDLKEQAGSTELQYSKWGMAIDAVTSRLGLGNVMLDKALDQQVNSVQAAQNKLDEIQKDAANKEKELTLAKKERDAASLAEFQKHILAEAEAENARAALRNRQRELEAEAENARAALDKHIADEHIKQVQRENEADTARTELFHKQEELENEAENERYKLQQRQIMLEAEAENARAKMYADEKKRLNDLKKETSVTFQALAAQWLHAAAPLQQLGVEGQEAFNKLTSGLESAVQASILSGASFGQAMEKITADTLASVASQAAVKSLFYAAEGTALLFTDPSASGDYFIASAEMAAVAAAAGVSARAIGGAGGSGGSNNFEQSHNSVSNTGQSNRSGGSSIGVQAFAEGGLITAPTMALMGEAGREAVIPLDDPMAQKQMRESGVGGDTHIHFNVHGGVIAESTIAQLCKRISKSVDTGKAHLTASNSLRITKRSA